MYGVVLLKHPDYENIVEHVTTSPLTRSYHLRQTNYSARLLRDREKRLRCLTVRLWLWFSLTAQRLDAAQNDCDSLGMSIPGHAERPALQQGTAWWL